MSIECNWGYKVVIVYNPYLMEWLSEFKNQLSDSRKNGIVLDIDDTLSWTVFVWASEMQNKFGNPEGLTTKELVHKYKLVQNVPYWASNHLAMDWILAQRASEEAHRNPPLIENADKFVYKIAQVKPILAYLTSRTKSLLPVTESWLKRHNFPHVPVIMKPSDKPHTDVNEWKAEVLSFLYPEVEGIVDDNSGLIGHLPSTYPGSIFLYGHQTPPDSSIKVIACPDWESVYKAIVWKNI